MTIEAVSIASGSTSPLSAATVSDNLVFVSGQVGRDASSRTVPEEFDRQVHVAFQNLERVLVAAGASLGSILKTTVFLIDAAHFAPMNEIYRTYFKPPYPARSTVIVAALATKDLKFEIEAIAMRGQESRESET